MKGLGKALVAGYMSTPPTAQVSPQMDSEIFLAGNFSYFWYCNNEMFLRDVEPLVRPNFEKIFRGYQATLPACGLSLSCLDNGGRERVGGASRPVPCRGPHPPPFISSSDRNLTLQYIALPSVFALCTLAIFILTSVVASFTHSLALGRRIISSDIDLVSDVIRLISDSISIGLIDHIVRLVSTITRSKSISSSTSDS